MNVKLSIVILFCIVTYVVAMLGLLYQSTRTTPIPIPTSTHVTIDLRGLPDDAIIEELLSNNWKVVRIKGGRFLFHYNGHAESMTLAPLPEP